MTTSLYDFSVKPYLQQLGAVTGVLEKGRQYCAENNIELDEIVNTRLHADMQPFHFQIVSVVHHSWTAMQGVKAGEFTTPSFAIDKNYQELQASVNDALTGIKTLQPDEVNAMAGNDVLFKIGDNVMPFIAEEFLMSFSLPNFYFHAATTYDILRMKGVPLGKRDFLGQFKLKS
ncbi:MAG: DUF1993 domain-containing protein [Gammaproteobacteria bacterium]|jgi:uncharacterized protein|nr:DUF1993 domain-containing protein [Gammaproteobacteria bacterium]MBT5205066.1 DUF1993 domain-containing protein [Gammaproteobacteria bacterium]MBT6246670.1 DUF1993 domain-containing protein [Gammaproteobacteria bacterium]